MGSQLEIEQIMKRLSFPFLYALVALSVSVASTETVSVSGDAVTIRRGLNETRYEIARDEIVTRTSDNGYRIDKVPQQLSLEALKRLAKRRTLDTRNGTDFVLYEVGKQRSEKTRLFLTDRVSVRLEEGSDLRGIARSVGAKIAASPYPEEGLHVLELAENHPGGSLDAVIKLQGMAGVAEAQLLYAKGTVKKARPNDVFFDDQWHLKNDAQRGGIAGIDANVTPVWDKYRGKRSRIGIIDDGLQTSHPDLAPNLDIDLGRNWNRGAPNDPSPLFGESHGTACAGVSAARWNNLEGLSGAAPRARLVGMRLIAGFTTDQDKAEAFSWRNDVIHIKSNSWGPTSLFVGPGQLASAAIQDAVENGRGGLGTVILFAGGNSRLEGDDSNYDGYANLREVIDVGAIGDDGIFSSYSEPGANLLISAPSSGGTSGIATTDLRGIQGYNKTPGGGAGNLPDNDYTNDFGGTSSACPLVAGVVALMLDANPRLTWRDVQAILVETAKKVDVADADWVDNGAGNHFNHSYGAGMIDAQAAVNAALGWPGLLPEQIVSDTYGDVPGEIAIALPDGAPAGIDFPFDLSAQPDLAVEHVQVAVKITTPIRGDLVIKVRSPFGTESVLCNLPPDPVPNLEWTFLTVRNWGESSSQFGGIWTVNIADANVDADPLAQQVIEVKLIVWGAPNAQPSHPEPGNDDIANAGDLNLTNPDAGTNLGSDKEVGEPDHANQTGGTSVWWKWTAPTTGRARVSTAGSDFDSLLNVYTCPLAIPTVGSLVQLNPKAGNDDVETGEDLTSLVEFDCVAGTTYYIAVDGYQHSAGNAAISVDVLQPGIALSGDLNFGNVPIGTSAKRTFRIENNGAGILRITGLALPAGYTSSFAGALALGPGAYRLIDVTFTPVAEIAYGGFLTVLSNSSSPNTIALNGTGIVDPDALQGGYNGLIDDGVAGVGFDGSGSFKLSKGGSFSAKITLGGTALQLKGTFDALGNFAGVITPKIGPAINVALHLDPLGQITGTFSDGMSIGVLVAERSVFGKESAAPFAGNYTLVFRPDGLVPASPQGFGFATVKVDAKGAISAKGSLADGAPFSTATVIGRSGVWPLYVVLQKGAGFLMGNPQFREIVEDANGNGVLDPGEDLNGNTVLDASDLDGPVAWKRLPNPEAETFPAGFEATPELIGSLYFKETLQRSLHLPPGTANALWTANWQDGGAQTQSDYLTIIGDSIKSGVPTNSVKSSSGSGEVSGSFIHGITGLKTPFRGVMFQKQVKAFGFFLGVDTLGDDYSGTTIIEPKE
jgi:subtilisin family serine protease